MKTKCQLFCAAVLTATLALSASAQARKPVTVENKKSLPLRVLVRPLSHVYKEASEESAKVVENVPTFQPYYVYTRPPVSDEADKGWYEVGSDTRGGVLGWMRAEDVMEWKQAMSLAYTHPGNRKPVLMFSALKDLSELAALEEEARATKTKDLYAQIEKGDLPEDFPVVSVEPELAINQFTKEQLYLLPILAHKSVELDGREGRLLRLSAATRSGRGKDPDPPGGNPNLKDLKVEIVFVVDMSASMQPFIDATRKAMQGMAEEMVARPGMAERLRFGLWGFRDSMDIPGIEFTTKNFTPELQSAADFVKTLAAVKEAKVGSQGIPEDLFSGMDDAMRKTAWGPKEKALRFLVLIGDAPGHPLGFKWNTSGKDENVLRAFANDNQLSIFSFLIHSKEAARFREQAETHFTTLAQNPGMTGEGVAFASVEGGDPSAFAEEASEFLAGVGKLISLVWAGKLNEVIGPPSDDEEGGVEDLTKAMFRAAMVQFLGERTGVQAPRDITAWVVDKDLLDPVTPSLEVRVLINKNQLNDLRTVLMEVMIAGREGQKGGSDFFTALQATSATLSVTPEQIKNAGKLADTGLIPEFLLDLPYKSRVMNMNNEVWASWGQDQQNEFLNDVDAKISIYGAIHDNPEGWVQLNQGDDPDEFVHPLSIELLP